MSADKDTSTDTADIADTADRDGEDFLQRWSRRKSEAEAGVADEPGSAPLEGEKETEAGQPVEEPPRPELTDADMPSLESLHGDSDVSAFLSPGVSEDLRRSALRKLFHSPKFNVCDGLDDYCDDFTNFPALGDIVTADMRHQMMRKLERLAELDKAADDGSESAPEPEASAGVADASEAADDERAAETADSEPGNSSAVVADNQPPTNHTPANNNPGNNHAADNDMADKNLADNDIGPEQSRPGAMEKKHDA